MRLPWPVCLSVVAVLAAVASLGGPAARGEETVRSLVVVGTLIYVADGGAGGQEGWADLQVRVDEACGEQIRAGEVIPVRCPGAALFGIGLGDQVRATATLPAAAGGPWLAGEMVRLGRGEFVNPGTGAAIDLGPADARILVKLFAPLGIECHQRTVDLLRQLAAEEPECVRIQVFDMRTPEGRAEINRERLGCATVLVNNRFQFTIREGEHERKVEFTHRPNAEGSAYNSEDVPVVVRQEILRLYGPRNAGRTN